MMNTENLFNHAVLTHEALQDRAKNIVKLSLLVMVASCIGITILGYGVLNVFETGPLNALAVSALIIVAAFFILSVAAGACFAIELMSESLLPHDLRGLVTLKEIMRGNIQEDNFKRYLEKVATVRGDLTFTASEMKRLESEVMFCEHNRNRAWEVIKRLFSTYRVEADLIAEDARAAK